MFKKRKILFELLEELKKDEYPETTVPERAYAACAIYKALAFPFILVFPCVCGYFLASLLVHKE